MVREQIESRGVHDPRVLAAMRAVPRHEFMPESERDQAYHDRPLPIGRPSTRTTGISSAPVPVTKHSSAV